MVCLYTVLSYTTLRDTTYTASELRIGDTIVGRALQKDSMTSGVISEALVLGGTPYSSILFRHGKRIEPLSENCFVGYSIFDI